MIESCEQTGHRRRITSALPSAQSVFSLLCAAESGIKTIVQKRLCPGYSDRRKILPRAEPSPLSKISPGKEYRILRHASYLHHQPPYIGRLRSPAYLFEAEMVNILRLTCLFWARGLPFCGYVVVVSTSCTANRPP